MFNAPTLAESLSWSDELIARTLRSVQEAPNGLIDAVTGLHATQEELLAYMGEIVAMRNAYAPNPFRLISFAKI